MSETGLSALRPLWDELDEVQAAASAALEADDMQAWLDQAGRGAELQEEIAEELGWRGEP
jgi:hypothetical protein